MKQRSIVSQSQGGWYGLGRAFDAIETMLKANTKGFKAYIGIGMETKSINEEIGTNRNILRGFGATISLVGIVVAMIAYLLPIGAALSSLAPGAFALQGELLYQPLWRISDPSYLYIHPLPPSDASLPGTIALSCGAGAYYAAKEMGTFGGKKAVMTLVGKSVGKRAIPVLGQAIMIGCACYGIYDFIWGE